MAISAVVAIVLILVFIAKEAAPLFYSHEVRSEVTLGKMLAPQLWPGYDEAASIWQPVSDIPKFGLWPLVLGTIKVSIVAMVVSVPLGVGAAVYVSQYAGPRTREIVKPVVELLAGIPSVVLGFFALMVMATWFQDVFGLESRLNALVVGRRAVVRGHPGDLHAVAKRRCARCRAATSRRRRRWAPRAGRRSRASCCRPPAPASPRASRWASAAPSAKR